MARQGRNVLVVERNEVAVEPAASWASAGGIRLWEQDPAEAGLARAAIERWPTLAEELEADLQYRQGGNLLLAENEVEAERLQSFVQRQHELGFADVSFVDRKAVFILGLGAGGYEPEYRAFGYPFDHRASRFEEALQIIVPLLREGHVDFEGKYYQAREAALRPRGPSTSGPPIWIGASRPRMLELTARYADAWNCTAKGFRAERIEAEYPNLLEACQKVGRDPTTIALTASVEVHLLSPGEQRKADTPKVTGTPEEIAEMLHEFAHVGVKHLIVVSPSGVTGLERFARVIELLDQGS